MEDAIVPVLCMLNQKGGVGKTSTCYHLAGTLSLAGRRVLLVDNDPQASLTQGFFGPAATDQMSAPRTIAALYAGLDPFPERVIMPTEFAGIDLLAGSRHATEHNIPIPIRSPREAQLCLRTFLKEVRDRYDLVLIDCPPNLHLCSWAALVASDYLVVPLQAEDFGAQGLGPVQESIDLVTAGPNPGLHLLGYLITMFNARLAVHKGYEETLRGMYGQSVFETVIPIVTDFKEAIMQRKPVALFKPKGSGAKTMKALTSELDRRIQGASRDQVRGAA